MVTFEQLAETLGKISLVLWFLTVYSCIQIYDSIRSLLAQRTFFKENKTEEKTHDKTNGQLLSYTLRILDTTTKRIVSTILSSFGSILFCSILFIGSPEYAEKYIELVSLLLASVGFVLSLIVARRNNRIVKLINIAKPTILNSEKSSR